LYLRESAYISALIGFSISLDLVSKHTIQQLFRKYGLRPQKRWGQNFLVSQRALSQILAAADLEKSDTILEIGPGLGALTVSLAQRVKKILAVEKDRGLAAALTDTLKERGITNVRIIEADALKLLISRFPFPAPYKVIANLPYNIAARVIRMLLESKQPPNMLVLTIQKEVGERICAKPPDMTLLGISVQLYAEPKIIAAVPSRAFWPVPKVDGIILKVVPWNSSRGSRPTEWGEARPFGAATSASWWSSALSRKQFFRIARAGFAHPRKQLINSLSLGLKKKRGDVEAALRRCDLRPQQRAQELAMRDWQCLKKTL